ncbi:hypothetical protein [Nocardiopsis dassonvillei]|uniref:hypothetical protein n=1 Tax=Nocardiopsis dassonvillei TaxID=2014 RepID=UPI0033F9829C
MRRGLLVSLLGLLTLILTASLAWAAAYDPMSSEDLLDNGFTQQEFMARDGLTNLPNTDGVTVRPYCKSYAQITADDTASLPLDNENVQTAIERVITEMEENHDGTDKEVEPREAYAWVCVDPELEAEFFCISRNRDLDERDLGNVVGLTVVKNSCWNEDGLRRPNMGEIIDNPAGVMGDMVGNSIDQLAQDFAHGARAFLADMIYWWVTTTHPELEGSPVGIMWPAMLGYGLLVGILIMMAQGIRMMLTSNKGILLELLRGLFVFSVVCASGVTIISGLGVASEEVTHALMDLPMEQEFSCAEYTADQQPDDLVLEFPTMEEHPDREQMEDAAATQQLGEAWGSCMSAQMFGNVGFVSITLILYIIALIMGVIQAALLFIREAALPILALLLPIAAAGFLGWGGAKQWLPRLLSAVLVLLLYKPMVAVIFAAGFLQAEMSADTMGVVRGLITLLLGVIAPGVFLKVFNAFMARGVEQLANAGSVANTVFMGSQAVGMLKGSGTDSAARAAEHTAKRAAAAQAAGEGGGLVLTAAKAAGGGPVGVLAAVGQSLARFGRRLLGSEGTGAAEGQAAHGTRTGHTTFAKPQEQHGPHEHTGGSGQGSGVLQVAPRDHTTRPGTVPGETSAGPQDVVPGSNIPVRTDLPTTTGPPEQPGGDPTFYPQPGFVPDHTPDPGVPETPYTHSPALYQRPEPVANPWLDALRPDSTHPDDRPEET